MPGDINRRFVTTSNVIINTAASTSTEIVMAVPSGANAGNYVTGVVNIPANTLGNVTFHAKAQASDTFRATYTDGVINTIAIASGGAQINVPASLAGSYSFCLVCSGTALTGTTAVTVNLTS